jgi:hypothetical protein
VASVSRASSAFHLHGDEPVGTAAGVEDRAQHRQRCGDVVDDQLPVRVSSGRPTLISASPMDCWELR